MSRNLKGIIAVLVFCTLLVCGANAQKTVNSEQYNKIFLCDSMLNDEQLKLKYEIANLVVNRVMVKNGHISTSLKEKDFVKRNIPIYYFSMLLENIDQFNATVDKDRLSPKEVDEMMEKVKKDYRVKQKIMQQKSMQ